MLGLGLTGSGCASVRDQIRTRPTYLVALVGAGLEFAVLGMMLRLRNALITRKCGESGGKKFIVCAVLQTTFTDAILNSAHSPR